MAVDRGNGTPLLLLLAALLVSCFSSCSGAYDVPVTLKSDDGGMETLLLPLRRFIVEAADALSDETPLEYGNYILAADQTYRKDPLDGFKHYTGGWNISEKHYWASVGFTAAPLFVIGAAWFLSFGLVLLLLCCCYCCFPRRSYSYSRVAYAFSLACLIIFTISAIIGCIVLYTGQGKFHTSTTKTLDYVVEKARYTAENLRNFSDSLSAAKEIHVRQFFLSQSNQRKIDDTAAKLNTSANDLADRTEQNSEDIQNLLDSVRLILIVIAAIMLLLAFLGFLFSIFGLQLLVYILVILGWILVTGTFILSGVFILLHNVTADTCVAMDEWVQRPHAHTALDDLLPCVDVATANESLYQSKKVTFDVVNGINQFIDDVANKNFSSTSTKAYYNQSGPLAPTLCNPWTASLTESKCTTGQVDFGNASQVWQGYVCNASTSDISAICISDGRFTPYVYGQLTAAVRVTSGLYYYYPFLNKVENCSFVRETFSTVHREDCPGLRKFSRWVYIGITMVSAAVMLSLILWVIYGRERRHRKYAEQFIRNKD